MRDSHNRSPKAAPCSIFFVGVCCAGLAVVLSSCGPGVSLQREAQQATGEAPATPYSIVCVIHGDGDYLYHDTSGNAYTADEQALSGAQTVALENPHAEVFIFHQRPRKHFLFVFPVRDGDFYYYRNGRLIAHEPYWRDQEQSSFESEAGLYHRFRLANQRGIARLFLYCGHEIPEFAGAGYDASYPDRAFTVRDFAAGVQRLTGESSKFDVLILSACFSGTPHTVGLLGHYARYVVASPENLHLSYFDLHALERLDLGARDGDIAAFAVGFARQAFERLTESIQTAVSVAVYDMDQVQGFVDSVRPGYDRMLAALNANTQVSNATAEQCDCADIPAYVLPAMSQGVEVFYRAARFGRLTHKQSHSGWECWRERGSQPAASQSTVPMAK